MASSEFSGNADQQAAVLMLLEANYRTLGDQEKAQGLLSRALALTAHSQDATLRANLRCEEGIMLAKTGHVPRPNWSLPPRPRIRRLIRYSRPIACKNCPTSPRTTTMALALSRALQGREHTSSAIFLLIGIAEADLARSQLDSALESARKAVALGALQQGGKPYSMRTGLASLMEGRVLMQRGDAAGAHAAFDVAVRHLSNTVLPTHPGLLDALNLLNPLTEAHAVGSRASQ